jgi:hypothetical protein
LHFSTFALLPEVQLAELDHFLMYEVDSNEVLMIATRNQAGEGPKQAQRRQKREVSHKPSPSQIGKYLQP